VVKGGSVPKVCASGACVVEVKGGKEPRVNIRIVEAASTHTAWRFNLRLAVGPAGGGASYVLNLDTYSSYTF